MPDQPQVTSVVCNHCGAPLEVSPETRFVTCAYCGYKLEVHRSPSAVYTSVLESIDQRTQQMASDLDSIRRQNELEALDRQWMMRRDGLMEQDKYGRRSEPSAAGSIIGAVVAAVFGIFWIGIASSIGAPGFFVLFGVVFVVLAIVMGVRGAARASDFADGQRDYQRRREELMRRDESPPQP